MKDVDEILRISLMINPDLDASVTCDTSISAFVITLAQNHLAVVLSMFFSTAGVSTPVTASSSAEGMSPSHSSRLLQEGVHFLPALSSQMQVKVLLRYMTNQALCLPKSRSTFSLYPGE